MIGVIFPDYKTNFNLADELQVLGCAVLDHQLARLSEQPEIDRIVVVAPKEYQKKYTLDKPLSYCSCNAESDADISLIKDLVRDEPFFVLLGNFITEFPFSLLKSEFIAKRSDLCFLYGDKDNRQDGYFVKLDKSHKLRDFKYNSGNYLSVFQNIFLISPELLEYLVPGENYNFYEKFLPEMLRRNKFINGLKNKHEHFALTDPASWYRTNYALLRANKVIVGSKINDIYYGDKCDIDFSAELKGEQFFGNNCRVGKDCKLKDSIFFNDLQLGKNVLVNNAIICSGTVIGDNCVIENAIVGEKVTIDSHVRIAPGTVLAKGSIIKKSSGVFDVEK